MQNRLSFITKLSYGLGNVSVMIAKQAPKRLCFPIYNLGLGVNAAWIGALFSVMRLWDAVTDPLVGYLSDNYTSRHGRRKPFIFLGAILTGITFALLWILPRDLSAVGYMVYLSIMLVLFYTALTLFSVPWYAMGYELTSDYDERTKLFAYPSFFSPVSQIGVAWLYYLTQRSFFEDTIEGVRYVGTFTGLLMIGFGLLPVFFVKEESTIGRRIVGTPAPKKTRPRTSFLVNLRQSLTCRPFLIISISITIVLMASAIVGSLHYYINIYYLFNGDQDAASAAIGWYWTTVYGVAALAVPVVSRLGVAFGKKAVFQASLFWGFLVMIARWFLYDPDHPYLQLVDGALYALMDASVFLLCQAMIADVCDYDELQHGQRREGVFAAVYGWMFKTGLALGALISGLVLARIGFDMKVVEVPSAETLETMRFIYSAVPAVVFLVAGCLYFFYPLSKDKMLEIASALKLRKADSL
jgi:glycoside/pentoside/hexuronide:cation symporter, GPH family